MTAARQSELGMVMEYLLKEIPRWESTRKLKLSLILTKVKDTGMVKRERSGMNGAGFSRRETPGMNLRGGSRQDTLLRFRQESAVGTDGATGYRRTTGM
jgi:hypothetical protein